jgi:hypothetical protein
MYRCFQVLICISQFVNKLSTKKIIIVRFYFCINTLWIGTLVHGSGNVAFRPRQWGPCYQKW